MIEFQKVSFSYGEGAGAIFDLTFSVKSGECAVLCGRSGSGKSTVLRIISGLAPTFYEGKLQGKAQINHQIPAELGSKERAQLLGVVFQDPRSQFFMNTVQDEICFAAENIGLPPQEIKAKLKDMAGLTEIDNLLSRTIDELSSGQKQKVAIASALLLRPAVLILDEPTSNLDQQGIKQLIESIKKIKNCGITVIISEHRLDLFKDVADQFLYLSQGRLSKVWTKAEFAALDNEALAHLGLRPKTAEKEKSQLESAKEPLLEAKALSFHYKKTKAGIDSLNLRLGAGEVISLLGRNGAGKTTLCKLISGLLKENSGTLTYKGKPVSRRVRNRLCRFVMQDADYQLYADSVVGEITLGKKVTDKLRQNVLESLRAFHLTELKDKHPASLSGGEKQRVLLAAAYCSDADIYILDEPTSGMDGSGLRAIIKWIRLLAAAGKAVIIITHDMLLAKAVSDRFIYLGNYELPNHLRK